MHKCLHRVDTSTHENNIYHIYEIKFFSKTVGNIIYVPKMMIKVKFSKFSIII